MSASLDRFAAGKLAALDAGQVRRQLTTSARDGIFVTRGGRRLISFSCNDYLNLSQNEEVIAASVAATRRYGVGAGASRLVTGNHPIFEELEAALADYKGTAGAIVFGAGYLANAGIVPALVGHDDLLLVDELAHACLWAGATLSGAAVAKFRHNDVAHVAEILAARRAAHGNALIVTDRVFSMDGDLAPMAALQALTAQHDAWLMEDDAHGLGVLPAEGSGPPLQMGTLSKAIGAAGGYLCASAPVIDLMRNRARSFVYSTGLPPGTVAAAIAALAFIRREPAYCARPLALARRFTAALGLPAAQSAIVPLIIGSADAALAASAVLEAAGFLVAAIRPPTVPAGTARLRFTFSALHEEEDVDRLAALVQERVGANLPAAT